MQSQVNWYFPCLLFLAICCAVLSADSWWKGPITTQIKRRLAHDSAPSVAGLLESNRSASTQNSRNQSLFKLGTTETNQRSVGMVLASSGKRERSNESPAVETLVPNPLQPLSESPLIQESPSVATMIAGSAEKAGAPALGREESFVFSLVSVGDQSGEIPGFESGAQIISRRLRETAPLDPQSHDQELSDKPVVNTKPSDTLSQNSVEGSATTAPPAVMPESSDYHFVSWVPNEPANAVDDRVPPSQAPNSVTPMTLPAAATNNDLPVQLKSPVVSAPQVPLIQVFPIADSDLREADTNAGMLAPREVPSGSTQPEMPSRDSASAPTSSAPITSAPASATPPARVAAARKPLPLWPTTEALEPHLIPLRQVPEFESWLTECQAIMSDLGQQTTLHGSAIDELLARIDHLISVMDSMIVFRSTIPVESAEMAQGEIPTTLRRLRYALEQRVQIWRAASRVAAAEFESIGDQQTTSRVPVIQVSTQKLTASNLPAQWQEYLLLNELQQTFHQIASDESAQRNIARRVLGRISSPILSPDQQQYLTSQLDSEWIESLKLTARGDVDLPELLRSIEVLQKNGSGVAAAKLNHQYQNLLWNDSPVYYGLAETIDTHFRNANLRLSISDELLNLMLPDTPDVHEPVNENILGANVRGQSRIANRLRIKLLPDASQIKMRLESNGQVDSSTQASRSGFVVENLGTARFQAFKQVVINRHGILTDRPQASSNSNNHIVGMRSNFDGMPIIGWVARRVAQQQIDAQSGQAESIVKHRLESTVKQRFDSEIENQLDELQQSMSQGLIQPLVALDLEPTPLELRTTDDRVVMRYRLAGIDQMAADSARPRGLQASLFSMQIHESALNNLLNRIELNGNQFTATELSRHLSEVFGTEEITPNEALDVDATLEFAPFDPIRISMRHDDIRIELNLRKFQIGKGKIYKNIRVTARYVPTIQGGRLLLVQDDTGISLESKYLEFRDQLAVRPVFNSLFKLSYQVDLVPKHLSAKSPYPLTISQFEVTGGWLGLSIDFEPTANKAPTQQTRVPLLQR